MLVRSDYTSSRYVLTSKARTHMISQSPRVFRVTFLYSSRAPSVVKDVCLRHRHVLSSARPSKRGDRENRGGKLLRDAHANTTTDWFYARLK